MSDAKSPDTFTLWIGSVGPADLISDLKRADHVLSVGGVTRSQARAVADALDLEARGHLSGIEAACESAADRIARIVNAPDGHLDPQLRADGWLIPEMPASKYCVQAKHVYAVAALAVARDVMKRSTSQRVRLAASCKRLAAEAVFLAGRQDMRLKVLEVEAERRRTAAAKGAPKQTFSDLDLLDYLEGFKAKHNGRTHGSITAAGLHFIKTEAAIRKRLSKIRTS